MERAHQLCTLKEFSEAQSKTDRSVDLEELLDIRGWEPRSLERTLKQAQRSGEVEWSDGYRLTQSGRLLAKDLVRARKAWEQSLERSPGSQEPVLDFDRVASGDAGVS
jgi:hypothetical protein